MRFIMAIYIITSFINKDDIVTTQVTEGTILSN